MNSHWLAIAALAALAVAGCRSRPEQRAVMDSYQEELRRYEGIIYDLEYQNNILCTENERLKKRLEGGATSKPRRVDEGPRLSPKPESTKPDEPPSIDIEMGDPTPKPTTRPGATNKPVMPEAEPEEKPSPEIQPPANREKPLQDLDSPTEEVDLSPPKEKPKPEEVPEAHPTDIDAPPLSKPADKPASPDDDEPPPQAPSILKVPNRKPPAGEDLPAPRPDLNPNSKPKLPELLPAPTARRTSFLDAAGSRNLEPPRPSTFGTPSSPVAGSSVQPQWTPRTVRRSTDDTLR